VCDGDCQEDADGGGFEHHTATGAEAGEEGVGAVVGEDHFDAGGGGQGGEKDLDGFELKSAEDGGGEIQEDQGEECGGQSRVGAGDAGGGAAQHGGGGEGEGGLERDVCRPAGAEGFVDDAGHQTDGGEFVVDQVVAEAAAVGNHLAHVDEDGGVVVEGAEQKAESAESGGKDAEDDQHGQQGSLGGSADI